MGKKLWGGRFTKRTDPMVEQFTSSIGVDYRLAKYDVVGSIAHATMLGRCGIISPAESRRLIRGLGQILKRIEAGRWQPDPKAEDVHTQMQQELERLIGPAARKLHTARSRNDQVSLDLRLYCREAVDATSSNISGVQQALVHLASTYDDVVIPGYTHLQPAQPVLLAHHLLAYVEMLQRDRDRLFDAKQRIEVSPLGAAALAGTTLPIDRQYVRRLLDMPAVASNSMDAVSDRDFVVEILAILASVSVHLSRLSEDFILWASEEFGWLQLDDAFATGSSLMPQKKNPDVLELIRGQTGLVIGQLVAVLTMLKGLPLTYNRDLQWDKQPLFEAFDAVDGALTVLERLIYHVRIRRQKALSRLQSAGALCATDLAEYLVTKGEPFATAHKIVGGLILAAERRGTALRHLSLVEFRRHSPKFGRDVLALVDPAQSVNRKRSLGSTNPAMVKAAIARWKKRL